MVAPAFAQEAAAPAPTTDLSGPSGVATNTVVVTGIRASMQSTLNLKRNSDGIVDGIVADDIGKFPDTNLAEAVQRISGVSIDRSNGEGQRVTVRGVGPDLNLVLFNGRQMPSANLFSSQSRSFDFSILASEAISQIQVYKSSRADTPAGGVGATINIMTGRPLDLGNQTSIGGKIDYDRSNTNLPDMLKGKNLTPEVSFLVSRKFGQDNMFGVSLTGSYQSRNSGFAQAFIPNGWRGPYNGTNDANGSLAGAKNVTGVGADQLYDTPQSLNYLLQGTQRKRTNSQLTFQFRPTKDWTNTLDYTYVRETQKVAFNALNVWFSGGSFINGATFANGPVQSPTNYSENYGADAQDLDMAFSRSGTVSTLKSAGFNTQFRVNSGLKLSLDLHHSVADGGANDPRGTGNEVHVAAFGRNSNAVDFTQEMPVLQMNFTPQPFEVTGSLFFDTAVKQTIDQVQTGASLKIGESSTLNFGLGHIKTKFDSKFQTVQQNAWTGVVKDRSTIGQVFDQSWFTPINYSQYFSKLGGSGDPKLFPTMWLVDFDKVVGAAAAFTAANGPNVNHSIQGDYTGVFAPSLSSPSTRELAEKTNSLYGQYNTEWDTAMPMHTGVGLRYEKTTVDTGYQIALPSGSRWGSQNEIVIDFSPGIHQTQSADYHYWLPSVDWDMDVTSNLKLRASWGVTIGRPNWDQIQGGTAFAGQTASVAGLNGSTGNPGLRPVRSNNKDLSVEWYYNKHSMVSLGLFDKDLSGFAGTTVVTVPSKTAPFPVGGAYWNAAQASGCNGNTFCIRDYIFSHFAGQPGVDSQGLQSNGHYAGTISGIPGDPGLPQLLTTTVNANKSNVKGAEINWQHMFDNGFGFQANYTYVKTDLHYNNAAPAATNGAQQFALLGQSNSANLVGIYENDKFTARLAYNWRGEFLNSLGAFGQAQPGYTEPYGQVDLSVGYNLTKNLALSFEAINLTNATQRQHGRDNNEVLSAIQFGPRYMIGARYKF